MTDYINSPITSKKSYNKPPLHHDDMIELLKSRGMIIGDVEKTKHYLQHTGYYRLSGYFKSYQAKDDKFFAGVTFDDVWDTYVFDRKLRLHTLDAIEKIEISLKANMNDILSLERGCYWYLDKTLFEQSQIYDDLMKKIDEIKQSNRENVKYYQSKYEPVDLPSRILFQELTIGEISNIYNLLSSAIRQRIADVYGVYQLDLGKRIQIIMNIRNICAHHGRLRNRKYVFKPRVLDTKFKGKFQTIKNLNGNIEIIPNYYNLTLIIHYLLNIINKNFDRFTTLKKILKSYKNRYDKPMGF